MLYFFLLCSLWLLCIEHFCIAGLRRRAEMRRIFSVINNRSKPLCLNMGNSLNGYCTFTTQFCSPFCKQGRSCFVYCVASINYDNICKPHFTEKDRLLISGKFLHFFTYQYVSAVLHFTAI